MQCLNFQLNWTNHCEFLVDLKKKKKYQHRKFVDIQNVFTSGFDFNFTKTLLNRNISNRGKNKVQVVLSKTIIRGKKTPKSKKKKDQPKKIKKKKSIWD